jgi:hypothetical protein
VREVGASSGEAVADVKMKIGIGQNPGLVLNVLD